MAIVVGTIKSKNARSYTRTKDIVQSVTVLLYIASSEGYATSFVADECRSYGGYFA
jgi:hypothetical protein